VYKKILIINPFGIGDVLFTTPIIHTLKDAFSGAKIGYLCNRRASPILENNPFIDYVFIYERDEFQTIKEESYFAWLSSMAGFLHQIKKERFEIALDFSLNTQYSFFSWYAGIKTRVGYNYKRRGLFLTQYIKLQGYKDKHIVDYYAGLLKYFSLDLKYSNLELYLSEEDKRKINEILAKEHIEDNDLLVGVIPGAGASWGRDSYLKHWPTESFSGLADKVIESYGAKIIIMGDSSEKKNAKEMASLMRHKAFDFSGRTKVSELAALINRTHLVITNDGGPLHIASALGKKTVSFFGPVDPRVYGPYPADESRHIVLRRDLSCSPCYVNFRISPCRRNKECLKALDVKEAFEAVKSLL
jgi:lipopolysaccharide heptosyltransferase II